MDLSLWSGINKDMVMGCWSDKIMGSIVAPAKGVGGPIARRRSDQFLNICCASGKRRKNLSCSGEVCAKCRARIAY